MYMRETNDPNADLEDLLFEEEAGGPSERWWKPGDFAWFFFFSAKSSLQIDGFRI